MSRSMENKHLFYPDSPVKHENPPKFNIIVSKNPSRAPYHA